MLVVVSTCFQNWSVGLSLIISSVLIAHSTLASRGALEIAPDFLERQILQRREIGYLHAYVIQSSQGHPSDWRKVRDFRAGDVERSEAQYLAVGSIRKPGSWQFRAMSAAGPGAARGRTRLCHRGSAQ